jgi:CRISPR-associated protein Cas5t
MTAVNLKVSVPVCSFRKSYAREYLETERIPPPSTVYGFLLSLVGEEDRWKYTGTRLAIAVTKCPELSTILRTVWRVQNREDLPGAGRNKKPDFKEILTDLEFGVWVEEGELSERVKRAFCPDTPVDRYGGLSLGESVDLVNEITISPNWDNMEGTWLYGEPEGKLPLPVWVDHVGTKGTKWIQVNLIENKLETPGQEDPRWLTIEPPENNRNG